MSPTRRANWISTVGRSDSKGGKIPIDPQSLLPLLRTEHDRRYLADEELPANVKGSLAIAEVDMDAYEPNRDDRFSFGLWTVGNPGRDPFGDAVRPVQDPCHLVRKLSECGAWGVNLHDNDLIPFGASASQRDRIVREFKGALLEHGMVDRVCSRLDMKAEIGLILGHLMG